MALATVKSINMIAIDLGSNSLRVIEIDCKTKEFKLSFNKIVKTADRLNKTKKISQDAIDRIISTLKEAQKIIEFANKPIRAVTTEAMRQAKNSDEAIEQIRVATDVKFEIISGKEEAELTLLAVKHRLKTLPIETKNGSFVVVDIGGASTEIIYSYGNKTITKSFPIGIVTLSQNYKTNKEIKEALPKLTKDMYDFTSSCNKVDYFIATAGTPTTIASMKLGQTFKDYDATKINGTTLTDKELDYYLSKLTSMTPKQREEAVGTGRADLITAGVLIFAQLYIITQFKEATIIDDGLKEGVALRGCFG